MTTFDAIVIGGGLAGAIAARDLHNSGQSVLMLEARDRLGGRTLYRPFAGSETLLEFGGTYFEPTHDNMSREIARYGLSLKPGLESTNYLWKIGGETRTGFPVHLDEAIAAESALTQLIEDARRVSFGIPHDAQALDDLDVPVSAWTERLDLPTPLRDLIYTWCSLYTGAHVDDCSMLHVLHRIAGVGNSPLTLISGLGTTFRDGTRALIEALASEADADLRLLSAVCAVEQQEDAVTVTTQTGERYQAPVAVVALPLNLLNTIEWKPALNAAKARVASTRHAGVGFKLWLLVDNSPSDLTAFGWNVGNVTWFDTEKQTAEGLLIAAFGYDAAEFDLGDSATVEAALEPYLPTARVVAYDAHDWNADPWSRGAWLAYRPGQSTHLMSKLAEPEGRLVFAGSDFAIRWPGRMEGALESGRAAAATALRITQTDTITL